MKQKFKLIFAIAIFALMIAGAFFAYKVLGGRVSPGGNIFLTANHDNNPGDGNPKVKAPGFSIDTIDGETINLSGMFGKPIVLNFWASWCPPCKIEMPDFDKVYRELGNEVQFMMVDLTDGQRETAEKGIQYIREQGFSFPVYFDTRQEGAYEYGIRAIPTTFFIDKDGYIAAGVQGAIDEGTLRTGIEMLLH